MRFFITLIISSVGCYDGLDGTAFQRQASEVRQMDREIPVTLQVNEMSREEYLAAAQPPTPDELDLLRKLFGEQEAQSAADLFGVEGPSSSAKSA
jgi:hypothetical protein